MKRAESLSMTTIIIAALAMLVLVVVGIIFVTKMGFFRERSDACTNAGGACSIEPCSVKYQNDPYYRQTSDPCDLDGDGTYEESTVDGYCCVRV